MIYSCLYVCMYMYMYSDSSSWRLHYNYSLFLSFSLLFFSYVSSLLSRVSTHARSCVWCRMVGQRKNETNEWWRWTTRAVGQINIQVRKRKKEKKNHLHRLFVQSMNFSQVITWIIWHDIYIFALWQTIRRNWNCIVLFYECYRIHDNALLYIHLCSFYIVS